MVRITPSSSQIGKIFYATLNGLADALTSAGSNGHVVVADAQAVTTALTVPAGVTLEVKRGGLLTFSGSGALTINGTLADGMHQMFIGGSPTFAAGSVDVKRPEWWGAKADNATDCGPGLAAAVAGGGHVALSAGTYKVATTDASGNGVTLTVTGTRLTGAGRVITTLVVPLTATWAAQATVARCQMENFGVNFAGTGAATYGVGVDLVGAATAAEGCQFQGIAVGLASGQTMTAAFAAGPTTQLDVAATPFRDCWVAAATAGSIVNGFLIGNGVNGNVLCTYLTDCTVYSCQFAVNSNGGGVIWRGGNLSGNTLADFTITKPAGNPMVIEGCRAEGGNMVFYAGNLGPYPPGVVITDYYAKNYTATAGKISGRAAGEILYSGMNATITLVGGVYTTTGANTFFTVTGINHAVPALLTAIAVTTDTAAPYPAGTYTQRVVTGAQQIVATIPQPIPDFACLIDGYSRYQGLRVIEGSNAKQGVATLVAGTVTVANTAVTATSRIFLTAQDNSTTGVPRVSARTAGTSFTITSSNAGDTGVVAYEIFEPA